MENITVAELNKFVNAIKQNSSSDGEVVTLGNLIEIKPVYSSKINEHGETVKELDGYDIYRYADRELMEEDDYDFDSDYICTVYL